MDEVRCDDVVLEAEPGSRTVELGELLDDDRVEAEVVHRATAAVLLRDVEAQEACVAGLLEDLTIDLAGLGPLVVVGEAFAVQELARGFAQGLVLGFEDGAFHGFSPLS